METTTTLTGDSTMKRSTRIHLAAGSMNRHAWANRQGTARKVRELRQLYGASEARRQYRNAYGPLLPLD